MNDLIRPSSTGPLPAPAPRVAIATRVATMDDLPFLDGLQKQHSKALGFFPRAQMEGYVGNGWVLVAEVGGSGSEVGNVDASRPTTHHPRPTPVGYCISRDRYLKRDELGVIYQLCVVPGDQRKLIGASLIKAVFDRSAYGCRLYCCWCAQDLAANYFWESLGFVPIAFRAGGRGSGVGGGKRSSRPTTHDRRPTGPRVHIFWQRRINADDVSTPYWYPSMTNQGAIREDRLVFPIPPGVRWQDVEAVVMPDAARAECSPQARPCLEAKAAKKDMGETPMRRKKTEPPAKRVGPRAMGGLFATPAPVSAAKEKPPREKKPKVKLDPQLVSKARELRDRYLEHLAANPSAALLPARGKYDVSRALASGASALKQLPVSEAA